MRCRLALQQAAWHNKALAAAESCVCQATALPHMFDGTELKSYAGRIAQPLQLETHPILVSTPQPSPPSQEHLNLSNPTCAACERHAKC